MDGEGRETEAAVEISEKALHAILPALYRDGQLSWNPTVNKMTALALEAIQVCII